MKLSDEKEVYIFSSLNERSALLAKSIAVQNESPVFVFFRASKSGNFKSGLEKLNCSFFEESIASAGEKLLLKPQKLSVYAIDDNESVNLSDAVDFINKRIGFSVHSRENAADLFVLNSSREAELVLDGMDKSGVKLRRINDNAALAYRLLYDNPIFDYADDSKAINVSLFGFGGFCEEMAKAIIWSSQRDGYSLNINIFSERLKEESFRKKYPELIDTDKLSDADEINYKVNLHNSADLGGLDCFKNTALVFVDLENDEDTIHTAMRLHEKFSALGANPQIKAILKNPVEEEKLQSGRERNISFISKNILYSENKLTDGSLEKFAVDLFSMWSEKQEADFYSRDFNYHASVASALFWSIRHKQRQSLEVNETNMKLEHRRWSAFMRTEGYRYGETRDDIKKLHPCLVAWDMLTDKMKSYDANPIRVAGREFDCR